MKAQSLYQLVKQSVTIFLAVVIASGLLILFALVSFDDALQQAHRSLEISQKVRVASQDLLQMESAQRGYLFTREERYLANYDDLAEEVKQNLTEAEAISQQPEQIARYSYLKETAQKKVGEMNESIRLAREEKIAEVNELLLSDKGVQLMENFREAASESLHEEQGLVKSSRETVDRLSTFLKIIIACLSLGSIFFAIHGIRSTRENLRPLELCAERAQEIIHHQFRGTPLPEDGAREVASMTRSLNEISTFLTKSARDVWKAHAKVAEMGDTLSRRAVEQSAALSQLSASIQQIASTVQELNLSADQMSDNVTSSVNKAQEREKAGLVGLKAVENSYQAAQKVERQGQQVGDITVELNNRAAKVERIVFVVNELTERSNILSINAALLAASSKEGNTDAFAVLADEMQKLTTRSKDSTLEIHETLQTIRSQIQRVVLATEETTKQVAAGNKAAILASESIGSLKTAVEEGNDTFLKVVAAVQQQNIALDQVDQALVAMRESAEVVETESKLLNQDAESLRKLNSRLADTALLKAARS